MRAEEQRRFARRYKIRQVIDCGVIGAELLEVSLLKLTPAVRVMAKPGPEAGARGYVLQPHVDAGMLLREPARPDAVDEHPRAIRGLGRLVDALNTRSRRPSRHWILQPSLCKGGHLALGCLRGTDLGKIDRGLHRIVHEVGQQELGSQRGHLDDVGLVHPACYGASDTPPRPR